MQQGAILCSMVLPHNLHFPKATRQHKTNRLFPVMKRRKFGTIGSKLVISIEMHLQFDYSDESITKPQNNQPKAKIRARQLHIP